MGDELSNLRSSVMLELSACNDLRGFVSLVEQEGLETIDVPSLWYCRRIGSKKMGFEERTPLMVAALYGSKEIVEYIIKSGRVDVNRTCGSDGSTPLHCAAAGFSSNSAEITTLLLNASADADSRDSDGNKPVDVIFPCLSPVFSSRKKVVERLLKGSVGVDEKEGQEEQRREPVSSSPPRASEKKEYPVDPTLPDIKNGIYGTDEFRMFAFKIKPCSRAYSHDWTECPFVHPGENARRRDPRKFHYSCVPCPEFRKGSCSRGDSCEYAHGIFECWLHPAQYRTRLCKDEMNCTRRVCFFAHRPEELRPMFHSTGLGAPSPRSSCNSLSSSSSASASFDIGPISPLALTSSATPPLSPNSLSSPKSWMNWPNNVPPTLQLPGSRLKSTVSAREIDFSDEILSLSSPTDWNPTFVSSADMSRKSLNMIPTEMNELFGQDDTSGQQMRRGLMNQQQLHSLAIDSRSAAFAKRSHSFIERPSLVSSLTSSASLNDWGSPDGKLDWSVHGDELQKFRKSASFGFRTGVHSGDSGLVPQSVGLDEPDVSWVNPLVKEPSDTSLGPVWMDQLYMEAEQTVA